MTDTYPDACLFDPCLGDPSFELQFDEEHVVAGYPYPVYILTGAAPSCEEDQLPYFEVCCERSNIIFQPKTQICI